MQSNVCANKIELNKKLFHNNIIPSTRNFVAYFLSLILLGTLSCAFPGKSIES